MIELVKLECKTSACSWKSVVIEVEDNGVEVICSGECEGILRANNPAHPNYPTVEVEPTMQDQIDQRLRDLGLLT